MTPIINIWINCPSVEVADALAEALLAQRLIASANRYPEITSRYVWKGEACVRQETPLLARTRAELFDRVAAAVTAAHPYETPSVIGQVVDHANADYVAWTAEATRDLA